MDKERFAALVERAVEALPDEFASKLENVDVVIEDSPNAEQLANSRLKRGMTLLGLYEGVPLTNRGSHYGMVPPDKITIFKEPIEAKCGHNDDAITAEIIKVVKHEIAHYFGISDARLRQIEKG